MHTIKKCNIFLEQGVLAMNEQQKQATARLQPEITNDYNSNAISVQFSSVQIDQGEGFKAVGYIARDVTATKCIVK